MDKITIISQQHYRSTLPLAVPLLRVTSTITSSDAVLLTLYSPLMKCHFLLLNNYCDWLNETVVNIHC